MLKDPDEGTLMYLQRCPMKKMIKHRVKLTDETPIHCKPILAARHEGRVMAEVDSMLEMGVVRLSTLPYASLIVMVKKKHGSNRVCVDFRKLNKINKVDPESMTTAEDLGPVSQRHGRTTILRPSYDATFIFSRWSFVSQNWS